MAQSIEQENNKPNEGQNNDDAALSQAKIEAMLRGESMDSPGTDDAGSDSDASLAQARIEALLRGEGLDVGEVASSEPQSSAQDDEDGLSQDELEALLMEAEDDFGAALPDHDDIDENLGGGLSLTHDKIAALGGGIALTEEKIKTLREKGLVGDGQDGAGVSAEGGGMSQAMIEALLRGELPADDAAAENDSGGGMSQEQIEALLRGESDSEEPASPPSTGGGLSQEQIEAMLRGEGGDDAEDSKADDVPMSQDDIAALFGNNQD